jgi:chemotaxis protein methyltransferase CheR
MDTVTGSSDHLSARDFTRLARFIQDYSGIKMPEAKKTMVEGRLRKRVVATGTANLTDYCKHVFERDGLRGEGIHLIDVITTNKTDFFREPEHFRLLVDVALPRIIAERRPGQNTPVKVWSTASSIGAEPYTLAMVLADATEQLGGFRFSILATDISTEVLEVGVRAIYPEAMIEPVPMAMRKRYLLRSRQAARAEVRIVPDLRRLVSFGRLNLMDTSYPVDRDMDVVFCRNMLIYFDKPTQQAVLTRLCGHMRPGGFLFLGHSESIAGFDLPIKPIGSTMFRRVK